MISLRDLALRRGTRVLFEHATLSLFRGEKIGITGANGAGKSSLFALILGELQAEAGDFECPRSLVIASVAQDIPPDPRAAVEFVLDGDRELRALEAAMTAAEAHHDGTRLALLHGEYEAMGGWSARARAQQLLTGLGFTTADLDRAGGWRVRLALAQALMCRSDVLLLDEPTNHLDLDAVVWLEDWLAAYPGTLLVIAHDREFLDRVVTRIVHIENGTVTSYSGNYSAFEEQRAARLAERQALYERQQSEIRHIVDFVQRFKAKASKARQAQSRLKMLERMERIAPAHVDSPFEFAFLPPRKLPRPLLALHGVDAGYGDKVVVGGVNMTIAPGDRIGLLGRNGAGKSTLTRTLAGEQPLLAGQRVAAQDLAIGYFAQHQIEQLDMTQSPLWHLRKFGDPAMGRGTEQELRSFLGGFGFEGERVFDAVAPFSGGEKARLVLALIVSRRPNLLLLDEPTNHLDLEMRLALGMALQDYEGALVVVSHDRQLLRLVTDQLWLVTQGAATPFDGDLDDYVTWLKASATTAARGDTAPRSGNSAAARREQKRDAAERRQQLSQLRTSVSRLERDMARLTGQLAAIDKQLADPEAYAKGTTAATQALQREQAALRRRLATAETEWLAAAEELETATAVATAGSAL
jgi:ATP-binding cassette subfamily F protein 3